MFWGKTEANKFNMPLIMFSMKYFSNYLDIQDTDHLWLMRKYFIRGSYGWLQRNNICLWSYRMRQNLHVNLPLSRMIGTPEQSGIMALTVIDLLNHFKEKQKSKQTNLKVSYIEIYN